MARAEQQGLRFPNTWGGRRVGAGRPRGSRHSERMSHARRPSVSRHRPHHITVRVTRGTWNLRSQRCYRPILAAIEWVAKREGFRIVHFSVQHNHLHLIVEAESGRELSNALRALFSRIARALNRVMRTRGRRFDDRYHQHILRTPSEVRNALNYVLGNRAEHLARWGRIVDRTVVDPFSSLAVAVVKLPGSWLLREGWTRAPP
jgi:REP element-mobilizing transposase RayT